MQMFKKKRIEIIIEAPLFRTLVQELNTLAVHGYTVLPVLAGSGHDGAWENTDSIGSSGKMMAVICVVDPAFAPDLITSLSPLIVQHIGILLVSDVEVLRNDRF